MLRTRHLGLLAAGLFSGAVCAAQTAPPANPAPCTVAPQPAPCGTSTTPAANRFPFPGENGSSGGTSAAPAASSPVSPDAATPPSKPSGANFPFPGETDAPNAPTSGSAGSSSSSSSSGDDPAPADPTTPDAAGIKDKGSEGSSATPGRHVLHRVNPIGTKLQSADEREAEDLDVLHFYMDSGDLQGAYLRGQDAVKTVPDDPEAHFALAQIAQKMNKRDEAIAEYNACLKLDPTDKEAKTARKELAKLKP